MFSNFECLLFLQFLSVMLTQDPYSGQGFANTYRIHLNQMLSLLDETVMPCENFFQHACGGNNRYPMGLHVEEHIPLFLVNKQDRLMFFHENRHSFRTQPGRILNNMYTNCKNRMQAGQLDRFRHWRQMIREIPFLAKRQRLYGHGPLPKVKWDHMGQRLNINWFSLMVQFALHGIPLFVKLFFAENTIFIAPADHAVCLDFEAVRLGVATIVHKENIHELNKIARELYSFCQILNGNFQLPSHIEMLTKNSTDVILHELAVEFLSQMNLTSQEVAHIRNVPIDTKNLDRILTLIGITDPRVLYNYILWQSYEMLRYEDCYLLIEEFESLLYTEYWHWHVFDEHFSRDVAMAMYLFHTFRFHRYRKSVHMSKNWDKFLFPKLGRKDFNIERIIRNHAKTYLNQTNINFLYNGRLLAQGGFYKTLLELRKGQLRNMLYTPFVDSEDTNHGAYFFKHFIHFCILVIKRPLLHYYATQGMALWADSQLLYSSDDFYIALDCFEQQRMLISENTLLSRSFSSIQIKEVYYLYRAFNEAMHDYNFWLESESFAFAEDFVLEYFQLTSQNVLFYAVAQLYCGRNDADYELLINRSFLNMPSFQEVFNCSADSVMSPSNKCVLVN